MATPIWAAMALISIEWIAGFLAPGPFTAALIPLGLVFWFLVVRLARASR